MAAKGRPPEIDPAVVRNMVKAGVPVAQIARWLQKTRSGIYAALRRTSEADDAWVVVECCADNGCVPCRDALKLHREAGS